MRLAFASDSAYPWFNGGIEKRRYIIMRKLAEDGHDVHCFTMHRKSMPGREFTRGGIRYHCVGEALDWEGMYRGGSRRRSIRMPIMFSISLFFGIFPYRFDALDADSFPFLHLFPLWVYAKLRGIRFAITWHEVWDMRFWKRYLRGLGIGGYIVEWLSARMADVNIANVSTTASLLEKELGISRGRIVTFPVAVDSEEVRQHSKIRHGKKNQFISVSRLVGHKRVELAIKAVAETRARLLVVGTGPDLEKLRGLAEREARGQVTFRQSLSSDELFKSLLESRALVMTSAREGLSLATVEALALGVPVVIANTTSLPSEVKRMCIKVPEAELGPMLNRILKNSARYEREAMGKREEVVRRFSADNAEQVYERVLSR